MWSILISDETSIGVGRRSSCYKLKSKALELFSLLNGMYVQTWISGELTESEIIDVSG